MNLIKVSIERPIAVLSAVIMVVLFGMVALQTIPIQLAPDHRAPSQTPPVQRAPGHSGPSHGVPNTVRSPTTGSPRITAWTSPRAESSEPVPWAGYVRCVS